ncbi:hypothetical protein R4K92_06310 [Brachyspira intermedia]|uniref:hypothetical protein n=1 Tax=Brachyspira intermedia TaxID=84377 RepID=UPI003006F431
MNKFNLASSLQSFYNSTLSSGVSYPVNSAVILSDYRLKLYSYNPPIDDIKIIILIHHKENYMSFKKILNKNYIKLLKNTLLIALILSLSYSLTFSQEKKEEEYDIAKFYIEKAKSVTIMPINGPVQKDNEILYNLLSIKLSDISQLKFKSAKNNIIDAYIKNTMKNNSYTKMTTLDYETFVADNLKHIESTYVLIGDIVANRGKSVLFIKFLDRYGNIVSGQEFYFNNDIMDLVKKIDNISYSISNKMLAKTIN